MTSKGEEALYDSTQKQVELEVEAAEVRDEEVPIPEPGEVSVPEHGEVQRLRVGRRPVPPTQADIKNHYPLNLEYRDWCAHCVAGKAVLAQHQVEPCDLERLGVTVSADYAFMVSEDKELGAAIFRDV